MNLIPKIAEMLGVEIGEEFKVSIFKLSLWKFDSYKGLLVKHNEMQDWVEACGEQYMKLLNGFYQIEKKPFKPKPQERFFYVSISKPVTIEEAYWSSNMNTIDHALLFCGNVFRTEAEAQAHKQEIYEKLTGKKWEE